MSFLKIILKLKIALENSEILYGRLCPLKQVHNVILKNQTH